MCALCAPKCFLIQETPFFPISTRVTANDLYHYISIRLPKMANKTISSLKNRKRPIGPLYTSASLQCDVSLLLLLATFIMHFLYPNLLHLMNKIIVLGILRVGMNHFCFTSVTYEFRYNKNAFFFLCSQIIHVCSACSSMNHPTLFYVYYQYCTVSIILNIFIVLSFYKIYIFAHPLLGVCTEKYIHSPYKNIHLLIYIQ